MKFKKLKLQWIENEMTEWVGKKATSALTDVIESKLVYLIIVKISNFSCYYCVIVKSIIFYDETNIHHQKIMFMPNKWIHFNIAELLNRQMDERVLAWILDKILTSGIKIITHRSIRYRTITHWLKINKLTVLHVNWNR